MRSNTLHNRAGTFFALLVFLLFSTNANADCCDRKGDFGCCGNGPCNIFCCNCDGGCNQTCEDTSCNTGQWILCAAVCTACAAACVVTEGEACAECMGPSYDACKGCYSSSTAQATKGTKTDKEAKSKKRSNRDEFFKSIAKGDGNDKSISLGDFDNFVQSEIKRTGAKKTTAPVKEIFKAFDVNSDGFIDRSEMDNESVKHGLVKD